MGRIRTKNDSRGSDKHGPGATRKGRRVHFYLGLPTEKIYDASKNKKLHPIYMDEYVCLTELAIRLYNIKENTLEDMAPFLSQYALVNYDMDQSLERTGHIKREAFHNISSLKVVKVIKLDAEEGTSYLVTFTASLRDESKNVETFETHICVPSLFPTMILKVRDISRRDLLATVPVEEHKGTKKVVAK